MFQLLEILQALSDAEIKPSQTRIQYERLFLKKKKNNQPTQGETRITEKQSHSKKNI